MWPKTRRANSMTWPVGSGGCLSPAHLMPRRSDARPRRDATRTHPPSAFPTRRGARIVQSYMRHTQLCTLHCAHPRRGSVGVSVSVSTYTTDKTLLMYTFFATGLFAKPPFHLYAKGLAAKPLIAATMSFVTGTTEQGGPHCAGFAVPVLLYSTVHASTLGSLLAWCNVPPMSRLTHTLQASTAPSRTRRYVREGLLSAGPPTRTRQCTHTPSIACLHCLCTDSASTVRSLHASHPAVAQLELVNVARLPKRSATTPNVQPPQTLTHGATAYQVFLRQPGAPPETPPCESHALSKTSDPE